MKLDRRTFLRGAAGASLGLPFLQAMSPRSARAQAAAVPRRIVFFQTPNGMQMDFWRCAVGADPTAFTLSPILAPLAAHRAKLLVLEGIALQSSYDPAQHATAHQGGAASVWTGTWAGPGQMDGGGNQLSGYAISHSLDHELAMSPAVAGDTRFPSYHFGVLPSADHVISRLFYAGRDQPIAPNPDPRDAHRQLFSDLLAGQEGARATAERRSVLDAVLGDYRALRCRLGGEDREVLDRHLAHVEDIEQRLGMSPPPSPTCTPAAAIAPINHFDQRLFPELGRLQMDLLVQALACDLTRVAALQWTTPVGGMVYQWLGHTETHHDLTHQSEADTAVQAKLRDINHWYATQLAYLLDRMDEIVEPNGRTLLDNSVVVWTSEISTGWSHDRHDMPFVLAGGCQGYFRTGRYLQLAGEPAHNRLHLSLLEAMGAPRASFGAPDYCAGGALPLA